VDESEAMLSAHNAYEAKEFLTSTDERFRPVNAYTGPDGALYIVDLYRGILEHKAFLTHYLIKNIKERKLEKPVGLGRIYRIVPEGRRVGPWKLPTPNAQLVECLAHPNGWWQDTAQRLLVERNDASTVPAVERLALKGRTALARLHALWTLEGMGRLE